MERKVNYNSGKFITSIPLEVAKLFNLEKGDYIKYTINDDGTVTITKAEKGDN